MMVEGRSPPPKKSVRTTPITLGVNHKHRALTRYEFAAGLNACWDRVNELIAAGLADKVSREDLAVLQRLQEEFAAELATLRGRVDALEARTAELEANQFSTTTKLLGEAIFNISDTFGEDDDTQTVFQQRVRLNLNTSFTGDDLLVTRLQVGNVSPFEVFYKYRLNDNIAITPGLIWLLNPDQSESNEDDVIATLRTTFTF